MNRKKLQPHVEEWVERALIQSEQAEAILESYPARGRNYWMLAFVIIGSLLLLSGVILVIASNWETIPDLTKFVVLLFLLAGSMVLGIETRRRGLHPAFWESGFLFAAIFPLLGLMLISQTFHLYGYHASGLSHPTVLLETRPVDPRDPFRGDYVILNYVISEVPDKMDRDHLDGKTVYVTLKEQEDGFWEIAAIHRFHPKPIEGTVLKGELSKGRIRYDLEKFFVPEGQGNPPPPITVEVAVSPEGRAQIKTLFAEGEPWPRE